ncbi:MAG: hypothetical protein HQ530_01390 [Parcubacteria group bacterium]|nr:hypothetical protein [Parcubacteria group bacterium]
MNSIIAHRINSLRRAQQLALLGIKKIECDIVVLCEEGGDQAFYVAHPFAWRQAGLHVGRGESPDRDQIDFRQPLDKSMFGDLVSLPDFISRCNELGLQVFVDLKWCQGSLSQELADQLHTSLSNHGHVLISYDRGSLFCARHYHNDMRLGIVTHDIPMMGEMDEWDCRLKPRYVFFTLYYEPRGVGRIPRGVRVGVFPVNSKDSWRRAQRLMGDDCLIITDAPEELLA